MPNRIIREGINTSERVDVLSSDEENFYRRLMSVVDDYGRYYANPNLIRAQCYPLRIDRVRVTDISRWIAACVMAGLIVLYKAGDGKEYIQIERFGQQIRAKKSRFPDPKKCIADDIKCHQMHTRASDTDTDTDTDTTSSPETRARGQSPARLHGIPASVDEVIEFGKVCHPKVLEDRCRRFWAHYEGQRKESPSGDIFWITSTGTVITNWKVKLPYFDMEPTSHATNSRKQGINGNTGTLNEGRSGDYADAARRTLDRRVQDDEQP